MQQEARHAGEEPKSLEDLASPRCSGKRAMGLIDVDRCASLTTYWLNHGKTQGQIDELFNAIAANSTITRGHTQPVSCSVPANTACSSAHPAKTSTPRRSRGAPVRWRPAVGQPL
jgi:iron(III) transport system substrate-binding protein